MKYLIKYEKYVQDIMSIPTSISKDYKNVAKKYNAQDTMSIPTSITKGNLYQDDDSDNDYIKILQPYYDYLKSLTGIKDLTEITHEQLDKYVGFSFVAYYLKVMIVSDREQVHMLVNNELIPLEEPKEIIKILESEA